MQLSHCIASGLLVNVNYILFYTPLRGEPIPVLNVRARNVNQNGSCFHIMMLQIMFTWSNSKFIRRVYTKRLNWVGSTIFLSISLKWPKCIHFRTSQRIKMFVNPVKFFLSMKF